MFTLLVTGVMAGAGNELVVGDEGMRVESATLGSVSGVVCESGRVALGGVQNVLVPAGTIVRSSPSSGGKDVRVYVEKFIELHGAAPRPITLGTVSRAMGLAVATGGGVVRLGTFGEFETGFEGGAGVRLVVCVPAGVQAYQSDCLGGPASAAADQTVNWWLKERPDDPEYWYAASIPSSGWHAIDLTSDAAMTAVRCRRDGVCPCEDYRGSSEDEATTSFGATTMIGLGSAIYFPHPLIRVLIQEVEPTTGPLEDSATYELIVGEGRTAATVAFTGVPGQVFGVAIPSRAQPLIAVEVSSITSDGKAQGQLLAYVLRDGRLRQVAAIALSAQAGSTSSIGSRRWMLADANADSYLDVIVSTSDGGLSAGTRIHLWKPDDGSFAPP